MANKIKFEEDCLLMMLGDGTTGITSLNGKNGFGAIGFSKLKEKYESGDKVENSDDDIFFVIELQNIAAAQSFLKVLAHTVKVMEDDISKLEASPDVKEGSDDV